MPYYHNLSLAIISVEPPAGQNKRVCKAIGVRIVADSDASLEPAAYQRETELSPLNIPDHFFAISAVFLHIPLLLDCLLSAHEERLYRGGRVSAHITDASRFVADCGYLSRRILVADSRLNLNRLLDGRRIGSCVYIRA